MEKQTELDSLLETWKKDSKINITEPGRELLNIPVLHGKYLNILSNHKVALKRLEIEYAKLKRIKWEYYSGKMDETTLKKYGWNQFPYVLKSDISTYMESDDDLTKITETKIIYEEIIDVCTAILKELNSRTYQLKAFIDYEKFIQGV